MKFFRKSQPADDATSLPGRNDAVDETAVRKPDDAANTSAWSDDDVVTPQPTIRPAEPGDLAYGHVLAAQTIAPGSTRDAAAAEEAARMGAGEDRPLAGDDPDHPRTSEFWVLEGIDGSPVGALQLTTADDDPSTVRAWGTVDPVMRRFGMGERLLNHALARARQLGATRLTTWTEHQGGLSFLAGHGFVATGEGEGVVDGDGGFHVTAELPL